MLYKRRMKRSIFQNTISNSAFRSLHTRVQYLSASLNSGGFQRTEISGEGRSHCFRFNNSAADARIPEGLALFTSFNAARFAASARGLTSNSRAHCSIQELSKPLFTAGLAS